MFIIIGTMFKGEGCIYYHKVKSKLSKTFQMTGKQSLVILLYLFIWKKIIYLFINLFIHTNKQAHKSRSVSKIISTIMKNKQIHKLFRSNQWDFTSRSACGRLHVINVIENQYVKMTCEFSSKRQLQMPFLLFSIFIVKTTAVIKQAFRIKH